MLPSKRIDVVGHKNFRKIYDRLPDNDLVKKRIKEAISEMWRSYVWSSGPNGSQDPD